MRDELEIKDNAIANLQNQISGVVAGNNDQVSTIAELENQLSGAVLQLKERDDAIANLKSELDAREDKQLSNPDTIKTVLGTVELLTVGTPGLVEYINSIDPDSGIIAKTINNAITRHKGGEGEGGQGRSLASLESTYNFKYLGQNGRNHQFSIPKL